MEKQTDKDAIIVYGRSNELKDILINNLICDGNSTADIGCNKDEVNINTDLTCQTRNSDVDYECNESAVYNEDRYSSDYEESKIDTNIHEILMDLENHEMQQDKSNIDTVCCDDDPSKEMRISYETPVGVLIDVSNYEEDKYQTIISESTNPFDYAVKDVDNFRFLIYTSLDENNSQLHDIIQDVVAALGEPIKNSIVVVGVIGENVKPDELSSNLRSACETMKNLNIDSEIVMWKDRKNHESMFETQVSILKEAIARVKPITAKQLKNFVDLQAPGMKMELVKHEEHYLDTEDYEETYEVKEPYKDREKLTDVEKATLGVVGVLTLGVGLLIQTAYTGKPFKGRTVTKYRTITKTRSVTRNVMKKKENYSCLSFYDKSNEVEVRLPVEGFTA